jgi:predicted thioesterase
MAKKVPLGIRGQAEETVEHKHTLNHHNDKLPPIYSTPNMIGLMEWAAANAMLPFLDEGEISVGTAINIEHRAPSTIGDRVKTERCDAASLALGTAMALFPGAISSI